MGIGMFRLEFDGMLQGLAGSLHTAEMLGCDAQLDIALCSFRFQLDDTIEVADSLFVLLLPLQQDTAVQVSGGMLWIQRQYSAVLL